MSRKALVGLVALLVVALAIPALAITNPIPDGNAHPQVGQLMFYVPDEIDSRFPATDPGAWFNCSGTVIADTVVLTAGHCTYGIGDGGASTTRSADTTGDGAINVYDVIDLAGEGGTDIWFTTTNPSDYSWLLHGTAWFIANGYSNYDKYLAWSSWLDASPNWIRGTAWPHPEYNDRAFLLHDAGVVVLDESAGVSAYGQLPSEGFLDQFFAKRKNDTRFTPVGYGLQGGWPNYPGTDDRNQASVMLVNTNGAFGISPFYPDTVAVFSNNAGRAHQGGTCYGDSGGPIFYGDTLTIVAVTSFGMTKTCTGSGGGYRIDQPDDLEFIGSFLP